MILIQQAGDHAAVVPAAPLTPDAYEALKRQVTIANGSFDPQSNQLVVPLSSVPMLCARMDVLGVRYDIGPGLQGHSPKSMAMEAARQRIEAAKARLETQGIHIRPYQEHGILTLVGGGQLGLDSYLLTDEMGTGKTMQALLSIDPSTGTVWVCPASLKYNLANEASIFRPDLKVTILNGFGSFRWPRPGEICVINYEIMPGEIEKKKDPVAELQGKTKIKKARKPTRMPDIPTVPITIIADEAHLLTHAGADRTKRFRALRRIAGRGPGLTSWGLTGTEFKNHPGELWNLLETFDLAKVVFESFANFVFLVGGKNSVWKMKGGQPGEVKELKRVVWPKEIEMSERVIERLRQVSLKRLKTDVMADLPPKMYSVINVDVTDDKIIKQCDEVISFLADRGIDICQVDDILKEIERTGQAGVKILARAMAGLAQAKMTALRDIVESCEAEDVPLVVFAANRAPIDWLEKRDGWAAIHGGIADKQKRFEIVRDFQAGKLKGVAGTYGAMGVGYTMTRASNVLRVNLAWTPADNSQAVDRLHRYGQTVPVMVRDLVANHLLDRRVYETTTRKQGYLDATVNAAAVGLDYEAPEAVTIGRGSTAPSSGPLDEGAATVDPLAIAAGRRQADTDEERWAAEGLRLLADCDLDHSMVRNDVGFSRADSKSGHLLREQLPLLTDGQWVEAVTIARRHHHQLVAPPEQGRLF